MSIAGFQDASAQVTESLVLRIYTGQDASGQVTEGLALTEYKFLPKSIALYFRYYSSCKSMMCILIEDLQINCEKSVWSWEVSQVLPPPVLPNVSHFWNRNIVLLSVLLEDVK